MLGFSMYRKIDLHLAKIEIVRPLAVVSAWANPRFINIERRASVFMRMDSDSAKFVDVSRKDLCSISQARLSALPALHEDL